QHRFVGFQTQANGALHTGVDGLDKTGLLEGNTVRDAHGAVLDDPVHDTHVFGEAAAAGLKAGRATNFLVGLALGEGVMAAVVAVPTGDMVKDHHPVAGMEFLDAVSSGNHYSGGFVPENARGRVRTGGDLFRSVPHIPHVCTRTSSSPGPVRGTGTV